MDGRGPKAPTSGIGSLPFAVRMRPPSDLSAALNQLADELPPADELPRGELEGSRPAESGGGTSRKGNVVASTMLASGSPAAGWMPVWAWLPLVLLAVDGASAAAAGGPGRVEAPLLNAASRMVSKMSLPPPTGAMDC